MRKMNLKKIGAAAAWTFNGLVLVALLLLVAHLDEVEHVLDSGERVAVFFGGDR